MAHVEKHTMTADQVGQLISYDSETGHLVWRVSRQGHVSEGDIAGTMTARGYIQIKVAQKLYCAHRLAWLLHYGRWPTKEIDHINGNRSDNRISNLRECSKPENQANRPAKSRDRGVRLRPSGKWTARMTVLGRTRHLGTFETREAAIAAYESAVELRFGDFAKIGRFREGHAA